MRRPEPQAQAGALQRDAGPRREELGAVLERHRADLKLMFPVPPARAPRRKQLAAGSALAVALAAGLWWLDPAYRSEEFATEVGQVVEVRLADGSTLTLDTDTRLRVQWRVRSRRVELEQGRAHFDVAHSRLRPFSVDAGPAQVRVVGTRFDVWRQADATRVWVYQGKVAVWRSGGAPEQGVLLAPHQQTAVTPAPGDATTPLPVEPLAANYNPAWRQGRLVFNDTPLDQVVATLRRYRREPLTLADGSLATLTLSGVFETANTDQLLGMLPVALPVTLRRGPDGAVEIRSR